MRVVVIFCSLLVALSGRTYAQQLVIEGQVLSAADNEPLAYCHIVLSDLGLGTTADEQGWYKFTVPQNYKGTATFSYVGHLSRELPITELRTTQKVTLQVEVQNLGVVTVTPGTARQRALNAIKAYQQNKKYTAHISSAYCHESAVAKGDTLFSMHALGYGVFAGEDSKMAELAQHRYFYDNIYIGQLDDAWKDYANKTLGYEIPAPSCGVNYNFLRYVESRDLLDSLVAVGYDFEYVDDTQEAIAYKGKHGSGIMYLDTEGMLLRLDMKKSKRIWSNVFDNRVRGAADISFAYYDHVPYPDQVICEYSRGSFSHSTAVKTILQKTEDIEISDTELGALMAQSNTPLINFIEADWQAWDSSLLKPSRVAYMKSRNGQLYHKGEKKYAQIYEKIELLKRLLFR